MINGSRVMSLLAIIISMILCGVTRVNSFHVSTVPSGFSSSLTYRSINGIKSKSFSTHPSSQIARYAQQTNEEDDVDRSLDVGGILGSIASIIVLYSEFVLKTTGCGLPAGPFGVVGAVEGVSYLGVVATCGAAAVDYFSEDGLEGSDKPTRRLATTLGVTAAVVGIVVLALQVLDYGYIPNAVPMEGGMCK